MGVSSTRHICLDDMNDIYLELLSSSKLQKLQTSELDVNKKLFHSEMKKKKSSAEINKKLASVSKEQKISILYIFYYVINHERFMKRQISLFFSIYNLIQALLNTSFLNTAGQHSDFSSPGTKIFELIDEKFIEWMN